MNHVPAVALADLLRMSAALGEHAAERDAAFATAGFVRRTVSEKRRSDEAEFSAMWNSAPDELAPQVEDAADDPSGDPAAQDDRPWHWRVVSDMTNPDAPSKPLERPAWIDETPPATREELEAQPSPGPVTKRVPLMRPGRFAAYLRRHLARSVPGNEPDINRICRAWASGRALTRVPMQRVPRWPARVRVVLDHAPAQRLYHDDLWPLIEQTQHLLGERVEVYLSEGGPDDLWCPEAGVLTRLPVAASGVLLLGALGAQNDPRRAKAWARWARVGVRLGEPVQMLTTGGRGVAQRLAGAGVRVEVLNDTAPGTGLADAEAAALSGWIACLHGNPCVTPEVLRTLRHALRGLGWPLALHHEAALFEDAVFQHAGTSMTIRRGYRLMVQKGFQALPEAVRQMAVTVQLEALRRLSPLVLAEYVERVALALPEGNPLWTRLALERKHIDRLYGGMAALMAADAPVDLGLRGELINYLHRYGRQNLELLGKVPVAMQTAWALANREQLRSAEGSLHIGMNHGSLAWVLGKTEGTLRLIVNRDRLQLVPVGDSRASIGYLAEVEEDFFGSIELINEKRRVFGLNKDIVVSLDVYSQYSVTVGSRSLLIEAFQQPPWAESMHCAGNEWRALYDGRWIAWTPVCGAESPLRQACWWDMRNREAALMELAQCEHDEIGWWSSFEVHGKSRAIVHKMRWISPGEFLMGSPSDEAERSNDEQQYRAIITEGFWLAETTCTNSLWSAVVDGDGYGGDDPVNASWYMVVNWFLPRLNKIIQGSEFSLPSEAQWEYSCRAGTKSVFCFGDQIDPSEVNYDGSFPYGGGRWGMYREKAVPGRSLAFNSWGLYQMHGNVWEWCVDTYSKYPKDLQINPIVMIANERCQRVLRGGAWLSYARDCRSAVRRALSEDSRDSDIGFRLVRRVIDLLPKKV